MTRSAFAVLLVGVAFAPALAQQTGSDPALNDVQQLGRRLYVQSCGVCHTNVQRTSALYGPALSKASLGGQDDVLREVISNGTPRMPGFKHHFERGEIDAIVAYLKTVPAPQPAQQR
jgi:mono/diheme cytochrome c family protein